jgi:hypothetical protein
LLTTMRNFQERKDQPSENWKLHLDYAGSCQGADPEQACGSCSSLLRLRQYLKRGE